MDLYNLAPPISSCCKRYPGPTVSNDTSLQHCFTYKDWTKVSLSWSSKEWFVSKVNVWLRRNIVLVFVQRIIYEHTGQFVGVLRGTSFLTIHIAKESSAIVRHHCITRLVGRQAMTIDKGTTSTEPPRRHARISVIRLVPAAIFHESQRETRQYVGCGGYDSGQCFRIKETFVPVISSTGLGPCGLIFQWCTIERCTIKLISYYSLHFGCNNRSIASPTGVICKLHSIFIWQKERFCFAIHTSD